MRRERRTATARHPYQFGKARVARSLKQIVKKVGTPRRRCPKHQARRAFSGIQRRLHPSRCATTAWQVMRERRTATARHPYQFGKGHVARNLNHWAFEIRLCTAKERGMAVSAEWRLFYLLAPSPSEPKEQTAAHRRCLQLVEPTDRRDALCPSPGAQKQAAFGIRPNR